MYVLTIDQRGSRRDIDRVESLLDTMNRRNLLRPFERTAGDEVQAVVDSTSEGAAAVVDIALALVRLGTWSVGIGVGDVEEPLPTSTRAGRGRAFEAAREAVDRAKNAPGSVAIRAGEPHLADRALDAETALTLVALLVIDRTDQGHQAVDLVAAGLTQTAAAHELGISKQAISQRLSVARWNIETSGRVLAQHLLTELGERTPKTP